jgi:MFS family permease
MRNQFSSPVEADPDADASRLARASLTVAVLVNALAIINITVMTVALPDIAPEVGLSGPDELWLPDVFLVAVVCTTPLAGSLMRRFGARRVLLGCIVTTLAAALASALTSSPAVLLVLAAALGAAAGPVAPTTQTLVVATHAPADRGRGMAVWGAGSMIGVLLGALLGGVLVQTSWRLAYLLCFPIGAAGAFVVDRHIAAAEPRPTATDWRGLALLATTTVALGIVLNLGDELGWLRSRLVLAMLATGTATGVLFVLHYRMTARPIVSVAALRGRDFALATLFCFGLDFFSTGQFETDLLGGPLGFSAEMLGLRSALGGVLLIGGVLVGGWLLRRTAAPLLVAIALVIVIAGKVGFTLYEPGIHAWTAISPQLITGVGIGALTTVLAVVAFAEVDPSSSADAASLYGFAGQLAWAFGLALLGATQATREDDLLRAGSTADLARLWSLREVIWLELAGTVALLPLAVALARPNIAALRDATRVRRRTA